MKEKNIQELAIRMGLISVEDMCQYTIAQLVVKIANKVNELVDEVWRFESDVQEILKTQNENIQYLLGEGLHLELENIFNGWAQDGTFDTLINQSALKKVNDRIDETNAQLSLKASEVDLITQKNRIDTLSKLQDGSTSGDAELIDARNGADGIIYKNVGDAIRTQINDINTALSTDIQIINAQNYEYQRGVVNSSTGDITSSTTRILQKNKIKFNQTATSVRIDVEDGYKVLPVIYSIKTGNMVTFGIWHTTAWRMEVDNDKQYRFIIAKTDDSTIEIDEIEQVAQKIQFSVSLYKATLDKQFAEVNNYIGNVEKQQNHLIGLNRLVNQNDDLVWVNGTLTTTGAIGQTAQSSTRNVSEFYFFNEQTSSFRLSVPEDVKVVYALYEEKSSYNNWSTARYVSDFLIGDFKIEVLPSDKAIRFVVAKRDNTEIHPSDGSLGVGIIAENKVIKKLNDNTDIINENLKMILDNGWYDLKDHLKEQARKYKDSHNVDLTVEEISEWLLNRDCFKYRGKLQKIGNDLCDKDGNKMVLRGVGTHHLLMYKQLHTHKAIETLKYYGINCIRLSVYLSDKWYDKSGGKNMDYLGFGIGYLNSMDETNEEIDKLVNICHDLGMYVILDWHSYHSIDGDVTKYTQQQKEFFELFAKKYRGYGNVLYELHNEPYKNTCEELLPSIQECVNIIEKYDPNPVIICGLGKGWIDGMMDVVTSNNLNIFISPHYYVAEELASKEIIDQRMREFNSKPIFISEWGNSDLSGGGTKNDVMTNYFMDKLHENKISNCIWKFTYQPHTTSLLRYYPVMIENEGYANGGFVKGLLSENGQLQLELNRKYAFEI